MSEIPLEEARADAPVVVIGASAGGVGALTALLGRLPADFRAPILVVLHVPAGTSVLPRILTRAGALPAHHAGDGDPIRAGRVLVAPPDHHLVVLDGAVTVSRGPRENGHRPAVDVLFRSAARVLGSRVVGVVLSGALDDGAAGAVAIALQGGGVVVQDPEEAQFDGMPRAALRALGGATGLSVADLADHLVELTTRHRSATTEQASALMEREVGMAELDTEAMADPEEMGPAAGLGCPSCGGALFEIREGAFERFRCRVGHAWSPQSLMAQHGAAVETALFTALRALEEKAALRTRMAARAGEEGYHVSAARHREQVEDLDHAAKVVRDLIERTAERTAVVDPPP